MENFLKRNYCRGCREGCRLLSSAVLLPKFTIIYLMGSPLVRSGAYKMELFFI